jgi:hypothetical protein
MGQQVDDPTDILQILKIIKSGARWFYRREENFRFIVLRETIRVISNRILLLESNHLFSETTDSTETMSFHGT